jgi:hypothetical protein
MMGTMKRALVDFSRYFGTETSHRHRRECWDGLRLQRTNLQVTNGRCKANVLTKGRFFAAYPGT